LPMMFRSCFGVRVRLRGQKRVPRPPARIRAWIASLFSDVLMVGKNEFSTHTAEEEESQGCKCAVVERHGTDTVSTEIFPFERYE